MEIELEGMQERMEANQRAGLETEKVMWKEKEWQINWSIDRWLEVLKICISTM